MASLERIALSKRCYKNVFLFLKARYAGEKMKFFYLLFYIFLLFYFPQLSLFSAAGIEYRPIQLPHSAFPSIQGSQSIHVLEIDPSLYEIKPIKALDNGIGRESVLSISTRYGAIASINGGFFAIGGTFDGRACGALKIHDWYALPMKPRGCIGWSSQTQTPSMDRLLVNKIVSYKSKQIVVDGLNRQRKEGEIILFTPSFHKTTLTNPDGEELVVVNDIIRSIVRGGSSKVPENGFILSVQKQHPLFNSFEVGQQMTVTTRINPLKGYTKESDWKAFDYVVGGTPLLIYNGKKILDFEFEQTIPTFLSKKHARTAVGILPSKNWIFVVVDKTDVFEGMTMYELVDLMHHLGCTSALNLDGGGSSTMVYQEAVKNFPHGDEDEGAGQSMTRRVSDAIVILPKTTT